jgi:hypothetical protein
MNIDIKRKYSSKEDRQRAMFDGELEPRDKNFFEMTLGKPVVVECRDGNFIKGTIRTPKPDVDLIGYIVEKEDGEILSTLEFHCRPHNPPKQIGYREGQPMIFQIDHPNHMYIFDSEVEKDHFKIEELKNVSRKFGCTPFELIKLIDELSEKYPQKFI